MERSPFPLLYYKVFGSRNKFTKFLFPNGPRALFYDPRRSFLLFADTVREKRPSNAVPSGRVGNFVCIC